MKSCKGPECLNWETARNEFFLSKTSDNKEIKFINSQISSRGLEGSLDYVGSRITRLSVNRS